MLKHEEFVEKLRIALQEPLPGTAAHEKMRPYLRLDPSLNIPIPPTAKKSAVLCLIYPVEEISHLALIERPVYDGVHSGQLAFPGGKPELRDINLLQTALREAYEEVRILEDKITVLGKLTDVYVWASNFLVSPFVAYSMERPDFVPDKDEVQSILEIPVQIFKNPDIVKEKPMQSKLNALLNAPYFDLEGKVLWGATAMMISELKDIMLRFND